MEYILMCDCGDTDFEYDGSEYTCTTCAKPIHENEAGNHLVDKD